MNCGECLTTIYKGLCSFLGAGSSPVPSAGSHNPPPLALQVTQVVQPTFKATNPDQSPIKHAQKPRAFRVVAGLDEKKAMAKQLEWKLSLKAMYEGFCAFWPELTSGAITKSIVKKSLQQPKKSGEAYFADRIYRLLSSLHCLKNEAVTEETTQRLKERAGALAKELITKAKIATLESVIDLLKVYFIEDKSDSGKDQGYLLNQHAKELLHELKECFYFPTSFDSEVKELRSHVKDVADLLLETDKEPEEQTQKILAAVRAALEKPAYKLMRCDESNPFVKMLHLVVIASFAHSETISTYQDVGKLLFDSVQGGPATKTFSSVLDRIRDAAADAGIPENDPPVPGPRFQLLGKDYRTAHSVLPSAFYEETFVLKGKQEQDASTCMRVVIAPSPAQADMILPEFAALLQAIENRRLANLHTDKYPYTFLAYTNLQNRFVGAEGIQTKAIMHLNERYPFSLSTISLSADSLKEDLKLKTFDEGIKQQMLELLQDDDSYLLENPYSQKSKYYFPPKDKEMWKAVFPQIIEKAYDLLEQRQAPVDEKITMFTDLVRNGIIRFHEARFAMQTWRPAGGKILACRNCAVCVDRGMMVNSGFVYALGEGNTAWNIITPQIFVGRGILAKKRVVLEERTKQLGTLTKHFSQTQLKAYLGSVVALCLPEYSVDSSRIRFVGLSTEIKRYSAPRRLDFGIDS